MASSERKRGFWQILTRRRVEDKDDSTSELARVMNVFDLTALGVGATLGLGFYTLIGQVAKDFAGPAACISLMIAAIASGLSGICYAEFAARVPKSGSAYAYSYVTVGEFIAFIIGWNLIFEYVIGTAGVARGLSNYANTLFNNTMSDYMKFETAKEMAEFSKKNENWLAFGIVILLTLVLSIGVQNSSYLNGIFGAVNIITIFIIIIFGCTKIDLKNWSISNETVSASEKEIGAGGFMPFGINSIIKGASHAFFGFVGFDSIAACGEEAKNPKKNIPLSIVLAVTIVTIAYLSVSVILTLMYPFYLVDTNSTFPEVFKAVDLKVIGHIINVGGICALFTSLVGAMFPLPRILYAIANDGLLFKPFAWINGKTQVPLFSTITSGLCIGIMALGYNVDNLANLASTGTLLAYSIVAMSVLFLRYKKTSDDFKSLSSSSSSSTTQVAKSIDQQHEQLCISDYIGQMWNIRKSKVPSKLSEQVASGAIIIFTFLSIILTVIQHQAFTDSIEPDKYEIKTIRILLKGNLSENIIDIIGYVLLILCASLMVLCIVIMHIQPVARVDIHFKVPLSPLLPCISIVINSFLMVNLGWYTWVRFLIWLLIGFCIYIFYGMKHSTLDERNKKN